MVERPPIVTYVLLAINVVMFLICAATDNGGGIGGFSNRLLYSYGAITTNTLAEGDYWRLLAAAFLHGSFIHIASNMFCLIAWAPLVEKVLGPVSFLIVYLVSAIGGSIVSILLHAGQPYLSIGASGALSGLVGALLTLTLMGRISLTSQFFVSTIALNGVIMATNPRIDWQCHLGGFIAGMIVTGLFVLATGTMRRQPPFE